MSQNEIDSIAIEVLCGMYGVPGEVELNLIADGLSESDIKLVKKRIDEIGKKALKEYKKRQKKHKRVAAKN